MSNPLVKQLEELFEQQKYSEVSSIAKSNLNDVIDTKSRKQILFLSAQANYKLSKNKKALEDILNCMKLMDESDSSQEESIVIEIQRAKILRRLGEKEKSLQIYDKILKEHQDIIKEETKATIYHNLANLYLEKGNFEQTKHLFEQAIEIDKKRDNEIGLAQSFSGMGGLYFYLGEYDQAIEYYKTSLKIRTKAKDLVGQATILFNLGSTYANMLSEKNAISYLTKAERIFRKLNHQKGERTVLDTKARMFYNLKNYPSVVKCLQYLQDSQSDIITSHSLQMTLILIDSLLKDNQVKKANTTIDRTIQLTENFEEEEKKLHNYEIGNLMHLKSQLHYKNKEYSQALDILESLQKLVASFNDERSLIAIYFSKSQIYFKINELDKAKELAQIGLKIASKHKDPTLIAFLDLLFGIDWRQSKFRECIEHAKALSDHVPSSRKPVLDTIVRTLQLAENDKLTKISDKDYNLLFEEHQIPVFYQDILFTLFLGKITVPKIEKMYDNFKYQKDFDETNLLPYFLLSLNLIPMKLKEKIEYLPVVQNGNKLHSLFSRIALKQVLIEDIRENLERKYSQKSSELNKILQTLDIIYYSIIFGFISKKYLLERNWSDKVKKEQKNLIQTKQELLSKILSGEQSISEKRSDIFYTNAKSLFEGISQNILNKYDTSESEAKLLLQGIIADLIIRTIALINAGEISGTKTKKDD